MSKTISAMFLLIAFAFPANADDEDKYPVGQDNNLKHLSLDYEVDLAEERLNQLRSQGENADEACEERLRNKGPNDNATC